MNEMNSEFVMNEKFQPKVFIQICFSSLMESFKKKMHYSYSNIAGF